MPVSPSSSILGIDIDRYIQILSGTVETLGRDTVREYGEMMSIPCACRTRAKISNMCYTSHITQTNLRGTFDTCEEFRQRPSRLIAQNRVHKFTEKWRSPHFSFAFFYWPFSSICCSHQLQRNAKPFHSTFLITMSFFSTFTLSPSLPSRLCDAVHSSLLTFDSSGGHLCVCVCVLDNIFPTILLKNTYMRTLKRLESINVSDAKSEIIVFYGKLIVRASFSIASKDFIIYLLVVRNQFGHSAGGEIINQRISWKTYFGTNNLSNIRWKIILKQISSSIV